MAHQSIVISSPLSPETAFARLIDLTQVPAWDRGVTGSRLTDGTPATVGARYAVSLTGFDRQPTTAEYELTAVTDDTFTMVGTHADFRAEDTVTVRATPNGCEVTYDAGLQLLGDDPPLTNDQLDAVFAKLVAVVETGLSAYLAR